MGDLACIILAAGKGTRMKSDVPKVMHKLAGRTVISWLIEKVENIGIKKIVVVVGPDMPDLEEEVKPHRVVVQKKRDGTAGAVKVALPVLKDFSGKVLILMGDEPLVTKTAIGNLIDAHSPLSVLGIIPKDPLGLGRMVKDPDGHLVEIVEDKDASDEQKKIFLCNGGNYCADIAVLRTCIPKITCNNAQGEYYLTDIVKIARESGIFCEVSEMPVCHVWGINCRGQLAEHEAKIQEILRARHMKGGVTLLDPETVYFSWDTVVGEDVTIGQNVVFGEGVVVADKVNILPFCHLEGGKIKSGATVGPFARIRPGSVLEEDCKIGNFVEVKNTFVGKGSKASHLTYLGDAVIGESCNIGAGTVVCNYDGVNKHKTVLNEGVFVGSNSTLVSPMNVDKGAYIAAGSVLTEDVSSDSLAIARSKQVVISGWAKERREKQAKE